MTITDPKTTRHQKTRLRYIQAFLRLIAECDFEKITVTDIAKEANYGRWMFYQYFQSKEDIAFAAFVHWMTELDRVTVEAVKHLETPLREYESWRILFCAFDQQKLFFTRVAQLRDSKWRNYVKHFLVQQLLAHLVEERFSMMIGLQQELVARMVVASALELLEYSLDAPEPVDPDTLVDQLFIFIFKFPPPK